MLFESVNARETLGGQKVAIDAQMGVPTRACPVGQLGVDPLAVDDQGRQQPNVLPPELRHKLRHDTVGRLRLHRRAVMRAVLNAQLDIEQTQEMPDFGGGAHGGFATAARQALLNGHGRWNAVHRIHLGAACGLHDGTGIGVQAFQVAALTFIKQNVKCQGGLARAADSRHHIEFATRNIDAQVFEVVLLGIDNLNVVVLNDLWAWSRQGIHCFGRLQIGRHSLLGPVHLSHGLGIVTQSLTGVRGGVQTHFFGCALGYD